MLIAVNFVGYENYEGSQINSRDEVWRNKYCVRVFPKSKCNLHRGSVNIGCLNSIPYQNWLDQTKRMHGKHITSYRMVKPLREGQNCSKKNYHHKQTKHTLAIEPRLKIYESYVNKTFNATQTNAIKYLQHNVLTRTQTNTSQKTFHNIKNQGLFHPWHIESTT
jgi:hypothetical protein